MNHLRQLGAILRTDHTVRSVAALLTVTVACLFAMHPLAAWRWGDPGPWSIMLEAGMLSVFGWAMWFWGVLLAIGLAVHERAWSLLVWAGILALLLYDDAEEIHEDLSGQIAPTVRGAPGVREVSAISEASWLPELVVLSTMGAVCLTAALLARARARATTRGVHTALIVVLGVGALLGVGADTMQSLLERGTSWYMVNLLIEQVCEAMTAVAIVVALLAWIGNGIDPARGRHQSRPEASSGEVLTSTDGALNSRAM